MCIGLATGLTLSDVSVAGLLGISESSSYSLGSGSGVCIYNRERNVVKCQWLITDSFDYNHLFI